MSSISGYSFCCADCAAGYTEQAPSSQAERTTLLHLLTLCLAGDADLHLRLVHALEGLSQQPLPPSLLPVVNPPMLPPGGSPGLHTRSVPATAAAAIAGLKLQVPPNPSSALLQDLRKLLANGRICCMYCANH